jgi:hypothetical protein
MFGRSSSLAIPREHLVHADGEGVEVAAVVEGAVGVGLLRRHVAHLALHPVEDRLVGRDLGDAEVGQLHLARAGDHDVGGGDVAVDQPQRVALGALLLVGVGQRAQRLAGDEQGGGRVELVSAVLDAAQDRPQIPAPHVLHHDEEVLARRHQVDGVHDVGVVQRGRELGLPDEEIDELGLRGELGQQLLEHHLLLEPLHPDLLAEEDRAHAPLGEVLQDDVAVSLGLEQLVFHRSLGARASGTRYQAKSKTGARSPQDWSGFRV